MLQPLSDPLTPERLTRLLVVTMPFGKYKGRLLADLPGQAAHAVGDLLGVEPVLHLVMTGERVPDLGGDLVAGGRRDQPEADTGQARSGEHAWPRRRP